MPNADPRPDEELIAAANAGDAAAFAALYYRYRDWVVGLAFRFTGERNDALDVLQDTFAYLLRKFPGFQLTARLTTFLYPVVKHLALAQRRKRLPVEPDGQLLARLPARSTGDGSTPRIELATALATLPEGQREVLLLRFVDDMSLVEIAAALAIPLGTVKSRLHNALETLRADPRTRRYFES